MANGLQLVFGWLLLMAGAAHASCEDFKLKIEAQLQARGIQSYSLEIVPVLNSQQAEAVVPEPVKSEDKGRVMGTCDQGKKQVIYRRP